MITVIGIFPDPQIAEQATSYLLGNLFLEENVDTHTGGDPARIDEFFNHLFDNPQEAEAHAAMARNSTIVTVHALDAREAQEAADVFNNYGALDVGIPGSSDPLNRIVEKAVNHTVRLRGE